ncbi:FecR family protein [Novosphingobium mangrovi (ex Huang et al. 2023)]|uniref:FecR domain-containing protein n=1 Tax=Novosphingobium mangrovi (ex Huang et al. 2023) TaxID=2976432 RepID=A0ABT2I073_9SPHN|nr:FecR domain-containing protein [Novosphingobium mangrovi (ex Huang et al. 2023)]MCT2398195.1 FecR domain-containing protein [Novosphingobium mangrovi (ex Huang et al. 2023)]
MKRADDQIMAEAARWHIASEDDAMDWDAFTLWLEADPSHRAAYDEVALADSVLQEYRADLDEVTREASVEATADAAAADVSADVPDNVVRPVFGKRLRWAGMAIAASLVAVLAIPQLVSPAPEVYETATSARRIALDDGSSIMLAPRSRLTVEGRDQDRMALSGGAMFDIRHDPDRPLTIAAGNLRISDIGTRFDVQAQDRRVRVAVVEGKVEVSSESLAAPVHLAAGKGLSFDGTAGKAMVASVRAEDVGAWQKGRLSYDNAPLALVVADLHRYAGVQVEVPEALRDRRFSGTLVVGDGDAALRDLAQVMGLRLGGRAGTWHLEQPAG